MTLSDEILTTDGLVPKQIKGRILVLACGALAHEILALIRLNGWDHLDLTCLPAILHSTPDKIPQAVEDAVEKHRDAYQAIFVAYADCGTGGRLESLCARLGVEMIQGPHCYSFFEGNDAFENRAEGEVDVFYLTDFLTRQFDTFVIKVLGLDRHPELLEMYFGNYTRLIYQAQTNDPALDRLAEAAAERLGLRYERRFTGYGDLATSLGDL